MAACRSRRCWHKSSASLIWSMRTSQSRVRRARTAPRRPPRSSGQLNRPALAQPHRVLDVGLVLAARDLLDMPSVDQQQSNPASSSTYHAGRQAQPRWPPTTRSGTSCSSCSHCSTFSEADPGRGGAVLRETVHALVIADAGRRHVPRISTFASRIGRTGSAGQVPGGHGTVCRLPGVSTPRRPPCG